MPTEQTRKTTKLPSAALGRADTLLPLQVRYYKRMRQGRTYPVQVSWKTAERGVAAKNVKLRLEVAGAIVVPDEHVMRPADPEDQVTFYVTPLATGKLRYHVLELRYEGQKIFDMPLAAKVTTQRFTWFLALLMLVVPWLLNDYCRFPYQKDGMTPAESLTALIQNNLPDVSAMDGLFDQDWLQPTKWLNEGAEQIGLGYAELCRWCQQYPAVPPYSGLSLFALTVISWLTHRTKKKRLLSNPIPLPD